MVGKRQLSKFRCGIIGARRRRPGAGRRSSPEGPGMRLRFSIGRKTVYLFPCLVPFRKKEARFVDHVRSLSLSLSNPCRSFQPPPPLNDAENSHHIACRVRFEDGSRLSSMTACHCTQPHAAHRHVNGPELQTRRKKHSQ
jgi:hypothetical protein